MAKQASIAIILGAALFALALMPGLLASLLASLEEALQNFQNHLFPTTRPVHSIRTGRALTGEIWLLIFGGALMILGLLGLLSK